MTTEDIVKNKVFTIYDSELTKVLIFGVPSHFNEQKVLAMIN